MKLAQYVLAGALMLPSTGAFAQSPPPGDVTPKDWSYQAIEEMANRGLVSGYRDAKFLGGRSLSRYEMAALVKRVIDSLGALPAPGRRPAVRSQMPGTAASRGLGLEQIPTGQPLATLGVRTAAFTNADVTSVRRLTDSYAVELAVMGVDLDDVADRVEKLEGKVEDIEARLQDPEGPLQTVISNVSRIDKIRISGYVQARYQSFEKTSEADIPAVAPNAARPPVVDTFAVRRARLVLAARPTDHVGVRLQLDAGSGSNRNTVELKDAWVDYYLTGNPATGLTATIGQLKAPFGFEVVQSSSVRETPERARVSRFFFPDERDRGAKLASANGGSYFWEVGVFNGILFGDRTVTSGEDDNNEKDIVGRIRGTFLNGRVDAGLSFDFGATNRTAAFRDETLAPGQVINGQFPVENQKRVFGADLQAFVTDSLIFRGEVMFGRALGTNASGYILTGIYNVDKKNQLVVKYDWFGIDGVRSVPVGPAGNVPGAYGTQTYSGTLSTWHVGVIHYLDPSTRVKVFYEINNRGRDLVLQSGGTLAPFPWLGNVLRVEVITTF